MNIEREKFKQKENHDKTAKVPEFFAEGERVWINNSLKKGSSPGQIVKQTGPLSFIVDVNGIQWRKHSDQMRRRRSDIPENVDVPSASELVVPNLELDIEEQLNENPELPPLHEADEARAEKDVANGDGADEDPGPRRNPMRRRKPPARYLD